MSRPLLGSRWRFPRDERVEAEVPYQSEVTRTERAWAPLRADAETKHWN